MLSQQMNDAILSNGKDTIAILASCDRELSQTVDDQQKNYISTEISEIDKNPSVSIQQKINIPTAVVKPKYQKSSYDDRQLPPIGCIDNEKLWHNNNNLNAIQHLNSRKIQQLPHFERKLQSRNDQKFIFNTSSEKESLNLLRHSEKEVDCTSGSVAIVTPRKKDKMEFKEDSNFKNNNSKQNCSNDIFNLNAQKEKKRNKNKNLSGMLFDFFIKILFLFMDSKNISHVEIFHAM